MERIIPLRFWGQKYPGLGIPKKSHQNPIKDLLISLQDTQEKDIYCTLHKFSFAPWREGDGGSALPWCPHCTVGHWLWLARSPPVWHFPVWLYVSGWVGWLVGLPNPCSTVQEYNTVLYHTWNAFLAGGPSSIFWPWGVWVGGLECIRVPTKVWSSGPTPHTTHNPFFKYDAKMYDSFRSVFLKFRCFDFTFLSICHLDTFAL